METKIVALSELCKISGRVGWKGYTVDDLREDGPLVIGANDIDSNHQLDLKEVKHISREKYEESPEIMIDKYDILIVKVGSTIGKVAIVDQDLGEACINPNTVLLKNCKINPFYVYYTLISSYGQSFLLNNSSASAQPALNQTTLKEMPIHLPADENWINNITTSLNRINNKIKLNNRINRELEAMAKTLYDYWFVQFDFPNEQGKPYKSSGGKMVYNAELKREIPEGWEVKPINTKVKIGSGFPFNSDDYSDTGKYKIITIKNVQEGYLETSSVDYVSFLPNNISAFCILKEGDILMSLTGNVGRMCFVDQSNLLLNQRVGKLLGEKDFVTYAYFFFKRPENQKRLEKIAGGSSQANLSPIDAVKDKFPIPTASVLNNFTQLVNPLLNQILIKNQENQHLTALRDWLLPMLMNGQVTGNEAEESLSMAAEPSVEYKKG
jgi:type I restriction enzyme S subunit